MKLKNLDTKFIGKSCIYYKKIDSTQSEIWRLVSNKIENGTIVMADIQTDGKGTHGRHWYTDQEGNIAFSFYVETYCKIGKLEGITIEIAKILINIFKDKYNINLDIKEPNDLYYNNKKIGGILTESKVYNNIVKFLVVGIGININQTTFNDEVKKIATSIKKEFEIDVCNEDIIVDFCNLFEKKLIKRIEN